MTPVDRRAATHLDAVLAAADRRDYPAPVSVYIDQGDRITINLGTAAALGRWVEHGGQIATYKDDDGLLVYGGATEIEGVTVLLRAPGLAVVS